MSAAATAPAATAPYVPQAPKRTSRLSPINQRRLANFKANRRGHWSFWIFIALFALTLVSEIVANDKPIVASYKGEIIFPVFKYYPEEKFGGFLAEADYDHPEIAGEIAKNGWAIWPPIRFAHDTVNYNLPTPAPAPPTWLQKDADCAPIVKARSRRPSAATSAARARASADCS